MLKAYQCELLIVALGLISITLCGGGKFTDWSASLAVFLGFLHAQLSFEMADKQELSTYSDAAQARLTKLIFILKESVWIVTFVALDSYPLLFGAIIFISYPLWRQWIRARLSPCY